MADGCVLERRLSLTALLSTPPRQLLLGAKSFLAVPPVVSACSSRGTDMALTSQQAETETLYRTMK